MISIRCFVVKIKGNRKKVNNLSYRDQIFKIIRFQWKPEMKMSSNWCVHSENSWFDTRTMSETRVIKGSKVISCVASMDVNRWPLHWPISGHCMYGKLYFFCNLHSSPINMRPFSMKSELFEALTPVQKVNDLLLIFACISTMILRNWLFWLQMSSGRIWDGIYQWIIEEFLKLLTPYNLWPWIMVKTLFENMPDMFVSGFVWSSRYK